MNLFTSWWYRFLTGCYRSKTFDAFLEKLGRQVFQQMQLSTLEHEIWSNPDIQSYYNYIQKHRWQAIGTQGSGRIDLGFLNRVYAVQELAKVSPRSTVIHVDNINHFIFYKLQE